MNYIIDKKGDNMHYKNCDKLKNIHNSRVAFIDIAKGIAIILMIIGHVLDQGVKRSIIFSFHMPLYIITSGFFYKERSLKKEIKNLTINLLIPTTVILLIVFFINNIANLGFLETCKEALKVVTVCWSHKAKIDYNFSGTGVLWFIYILIGIRVLFRLNKKVAKENELFLCLIVLLETYIGYLVGINGYWLPWSIDVAFSSMIFYYVGYIFNKYKGLEKISKNYKIIIIVCIIWILGIKYNWIELAVRRYPNGLWSYIAAISGTIIILKISMIIEYRFALLTSILSWCGKNSLYILFGHHIEGNLIKYDIIIKNDTIYKLVLSLYKCLNSIIFAALILNFKKLINKKLKKTKTTKNKDEVLLIG